MSDAKAVGMNICEIMEGKYQQERSASVGVLQVTHGDADDNFVDNGLFRFQTETMGELER